MSTLSLWLMTASESVPEATPSVLQTMFEKIGELPLSIWLALTALLVLGIVLLFVGKNKSKWNTSTIAFAALAIALSFLLSNIRLYRMPQGGSITLASMLPMMLFAYAFGPGPGILAGLVQGLLQFFQDPFILPIAPLYAACQFILDYLLAFGLVGLAGTGRKLIKKEALSLAVGIFFTSALRFLCSVASGVLFFAENLCATRLHLYLRRKLNRWGKAWNYLSLARMQELLVPFRLAEFHTYGLVGCFWKDHALTKALDALLCGQKPSARHYMCYGVAEKPEA